MKNKLKISIFLLITLLCAGSLVVAKTSTFTPSTTNPTMVTLEDIYNRLQTEEGFRNQTPGSHTITTNNEPSGTMYTLEDIWDSINNFGLPDESSVEAGLGYGPGGIMGGSLDVGSGALEWSANQSNATWTSANEFCNGTPNSSSGDYSEGWRLPTISELLLGLSDQFLVDSASGFVSGVTYWSNNAYGVDSAYTALYNANQVNHSYADKAWTGYVRCVK